MVRKPVSRGGTSAAPPAPRLRRAYFECRFGQLHVHNAIPAGGGFDERTPLLCVHEPGATGRVFVPLLAALGRDRSVYAPDLPGCGESDGPAAAASVADLAAALGDFIDAMRLRQIDVLARRAGSAVALELARARPQQLGRIALIGPPASAPATFTSARLRQIPESAGPESASAESLVTALRDFLV